VPIGVTAGVPGANLAGHGGFSRPPRLERMPLGIWRARCMRPIRQRRKPAYALESNNPTELRIKRLNPHLLVQLGERKHEKEEKGKTYHRIERQHGQFRRIIPLDLPVDADKVGAEYKDGVLHVTVPKSETAKPKRIEVKA